MRRIVCIIAVLRSCVLAGPAKSLQQEEPEDPENETMNSENRLSHAYCR